MPLTQLDPTPALIVIDLQRGIVSMPTAHPIAGILANTTKLARAFRERNLPVVLVNVTGQAPGRTDAGHRNLAGFPPDWAELDPRARAAAHRLSRHQAAHRRLHRHLARRIPPPARCNPDHPRRSLHQRRSRIHRSQRPRLRLPRRPRHRRHDRPRPRQPPSQHRESLPSHRRNRHHRKRSQASRRPQCDCCEGIAQPDFRI